MISAVLYSYLVNDWKERLVSQLDRIKRSGLHDVLSEFKLVVCDPNGDQKEEISKIADRPNTDLTYSTVNHGSEYLGLCTVADLARSDDRKILYMHTKGVFNKYKNFTTYEKDELKIKGCKSWADMMEYHLVDNWKRCIDLLEENDTVGVINRGGWWWGNFWWTKSSHLARNTPFSTYYTGSRWSAEAWLHDIKERDSIKYFELNPINYDPCYSHLPSYVWEGPKNFKVEVISAHYGYFGNQRDEGRPTPEHPSFVDVTEKVEHSVNDSGIIDITPDSTAGGKDVAYGLEKSLRIRFRTDIDPENEYIVSSFGGDRVSLT